MIGKLRSNNFIIQDQIHFFCRKEYNEQVLFLFHENKFITDSFSG